MADIYKITEVIAKVLQILYVIAAVATLVGGLIMIAIGLTDLDMEKFMGDSDSMINTWGMAISTAMVSSDDIVKVLGAALIVSSILYLLATMIFRNIYLIVRTARGGTWFSKGETPFQDDNIRMVREIGIFLIAMYIVQLVGTGIVHLVASHVESSTSMMVLFLGIIMICLSKIFEYGKGLEETQEGLI